MLSYLFATGTLPPSLTWRLLAVVLPAHAVLLFWSLSCTAVATYLAAANPFTTLFPNCSHSPTAMGCDCTIAPAAAAEVSDGPASSGAGGAHNALGCWDGTGMPCSCAHDSTKLRSVQLVCMHATSRRMHGSHAGLRKHSTSQWCRCAGYVQWLASSQPHNTRKTPWPACLSVPQAM